MLQTFCQILTFVILLTFFGGKAQTISEYELELARKSFDGKAGSDLLYEEFCSLSRKARSFNNVNPDSAKVYYMACDSFLIKHKLPLLRKRLLLDYGFQRSRISDADEAFRIGVILTRQGIEDDNYFFRFCFYRIMSQANKSQNKLKDAIEFAMKAKQALVDGNQTEPDRKIAAYNNFFIINIQSDLSNLFKDTQQFSKSAQLQQDNLEKIQSLTKAELTLADKEEKDKDLYFANSYNNLALTFITQLQESEKPMPDSNIVIYLNNAIAASERINNMVFLGSAYYNLANYYDVIGNLPKRLEALEKSLEINETMNNEVGIVYCKADIASTLVKLNQSPERALKSGREAIEGTWSLSEFGNRGGIYLSYCEALNFNGKLSEGVVYFDSAKTFVTDELKSTFDKEITEMQTKYETVEKEKEILQKNTEIKQKQAHMNYLYGGLGAFAIIASLAYRSFLQKKRANVIIQYEKDRSDNLLLNILPADTAEELKSKGKTTAKSYDNCTVMFTDFVGFTNMAEKLTPQQLVSEIDFCFKEFDSIISNYNIEKIKTIGDAYMCVSNLPRENANHAVDMVNAAIEIRNFISELHAKRTLKNEISFRIRIGLHTGSLVAGVVGTKKFAYDVWGDTVNIASRMESSGEDGKVNVSGTTFEKIKDHFNCEYRGKIQAKNKGNIDMYFVNRSLGVG